MNLYRIHIKPAGNKGRDFTFNYCLKEGVLGLGYQTYSDKPVSNWDEYESEAKLRHIPKALKNVRTFRGKLKKDDLLWTRSPGGEKYLAKVNSEWEYCTNEEARNADIVNVVRCEIHQVKSIDVPGKIEACFRGARTFQMVHDYASLRYSQYLWNELTQSDYYKISHEPLENIFSFLSAEEAEDLVFIYLQIQGWIVIPNSRKADTMSFEFLAKNRENGSVAAVQVKSGNVPLNRENYEAITSVDRIFLFQTNGMYLGEESKNIECISPELMKEFINENNKIIPATITRWHYLVNSTL